MSSIFVICEKISTRCSCAFSCFRIFTCSSFETSANSAQRCAGEQQLVGGAVGAQGTEKLASVAPQPMGLVDHQRSPIYAAQKGGVCGDQIVTGQQHVELKLGVLGRHLLGIYLLEAQLVSPDYSSRGL